MIRLPLQAMEYADVVELVDSLDLGAVTSVKVFECKDESGKLKVMDSILEQKSFQFAIRTVNLCKHLRNTQKEYTLSKQLLRSGTSIGANIAEAQQAQSKPDFISKLSIALKETTETKYWIRLLYATGYLSEQEYRSIHSDCTELEKMLVASVKTAKEG